MTDWFGTLPDRWNTSPLGHLFTDRRETVSDRDYPALSVTKEGVIEQMENIAKTDNNDQRKLVKVGDIAINSRSDRKGSSGKVPRDGSVSVITTVLNPRTKIEIDYYHHLIRSVVFQEEYYRWGSGIVADLWSTRYSAMKSIQMPVPPLEEQRAIADFLDRETAEIDAFIADQERLIELLTERRTATITHAVTKGLDPSAPMRDSGIPWLGQIPAHWQLLRFSHFASINSGQVDPRGVDYRDMVLIAPNHVESWTGKIKYMETAAEQGADSGKYYARKGQVIFSKIRPTLMKTVIAPKDVLCSADMYAISCSYRFISNEYLAAYLRSTPFHDYARDQSMRVAMPKLNHETLNAAVIPVPPRHEQDAVIRELVNVSSELDSLISDAKRAIELSKERRAALISAAVTGQIDVRTLS